MGGSVSEPRELSGEGRTYHSFFLTPVPTLPCRRAANQEHLPWEGR